VSDILSQKELDALMDISVNEKDEDISQDSHAVVYNSNILDTLRIVHEKVANLLENDFFLKMNFVAKLKLYSVEKITYNEFLMLLPKKAKFSIFSMNPLSGKGVIDINNSLAFSMVNMLLGGDGNYSEKEEDFSDIEWDIFKIILMTVIETLKKAYEPLIKLDIMLESKIDRSKIILDSTQKDIAMFALEVDIGTNIGMINIYYPLESVEPILSNLSAYSDGADVMLEADLCNIELNLKDVLKLEVGDVIKLSNMSNKSKIYIDGKYKFKGKIESMGLKKSVCITQVNKEFADG